MEYQISIIIKSDLIEERIYPRFYSMAQIKGYEIIEIIFGKFWRNFREICTFDKLCSCTRIS